MPSKQVPITSRFTPRSTAVDILAGVNLAGKIAIVTGGYSGVGLPATRALSAAGATVIVPVRTPGKATEKLREIPHVESVPLDLMDPQSIDRFARTFLQSGRALDILINSAGIMATPLQRDGRDYESQFSTNHLGHFHLTARLWPALKKAARARVVSVSSAGHAGSPVHFDDVNYTARDYNKWAASGQSKTANVLFAVALDARGKGAGVRAFAVHPGSIQTDLARHLSLADLQAIGLRDVAGNIPPHMIDRYKTPEQGASTMTWCAVGDELNDTGGVYCEDNNISEEVAADAKSYTGVRPWAIDGKAADTLWALSESLTGVSFAI